MANPFDQFDVFGGTNPFDQFEPSLSSEATSTAVPSWSEVPGQALANVPSSAVNLVKSIAQPIIHPIETASSLYKIGKGAVSKAAGALGAEQLPTEKASNEAALNAVGQFFADRYGGLDALKKTMATDPVGFLADAAAILTGGEGVLARVPGVVGKTAEIAGTVGRTIDPITQAGRVVDTAARGVGAAASLPLSLTTGVAPRNILTAGRAGMEGNPAFVEHMRGNADVNQPVEMADSALRQIAQDRAAAYQAGMTGVKADKTVLDFSPINKSVLDARNIVEFHGVTKNREALGTYEAIKALVDQWQQQPYQLVAGKPVWPHRTAEGLDELKQAVGEVRTLTKFGTLSRKVADDIYNSIKAQITRQAPEYAKTMSGYAEASDKLKELRKTFSLSESATTDTALKKLHSILRNNVNTNYGARVKLGEELAKKEPDLPYAIAGQTMSSVLPRGLATQLLTGAEAVGGGYAAAAGFFHPAVLAALAAASPRLVGEVAHLSGRILSALRKSKGISPPVRGAYQLGRLHEPLRVYLNAGERDRLAENSQ